MSKPQSVLVVDDDEPIRRNVGVYLEDLGYRVALAANGIEGLAVFWREHPDLVVTDLRMPEMDGTALVTALRDTSPGTPVIVISGTGDLREAMGAVHAGAWDYVLKPITDPDQLDIVIRRALERARLVEENRQYHADLESLVATRTHELFERERTLRIVADNTWDWEWWRAPDRRFLYCSPSCERITGYGPGDLMDDPGLFARIIHPDDRPRILQHLEGTPTPAPDAVEFRVLPRSGSTRWVELVCRAIVDDEGGILGLRGSTRDVSERKKMETQLLRMQRQESLGRIANGIAHDLNNVLAPVMMAGDLLQDAGLTDTQKAYVEMIRQSAARGADMVKQLLLYSRGSDGRRTMVKPGDVVRDTFRMISETFPKNINIHVDMPADTEPIEADQTQLHQVVLNLCVNARDAMPAGGLLALAVEQIELDEVAARGTLRSPSGPYVVITVVDTGTGIAADILDQIFDPFFTTKPQGQGTGLGLSTVQGIVTSHGGFIDVRSEPGRGSEFRIYLPAKPGQGGPRTGAPAARATSRGRGQTVLVVDDEKPIRDMLQRLLHNHGYQVLVAEGGGEALEIYGRSPGTIDVVLMDTWMPHMDGLATIRQLALRDPDARVIAMSGLTESQEQILGISPVVKKFLAKPWNMDELLSALNDVLTASGTGGDE